MSRMYGGPKNEWFKPIIEPTIQLVSIGLKIRLRYPVSNGNCKVPEVVDEMLSPYCTRCLLISLA